MNSTANFKERGKEKIAWQNKITFHINGTNMLVNKQKMLYKRNIRLIV